MQVQVLSTAPKAPLAGAFFAEFSHDIPFDIHIANVFPRRLFGFDAVVLRFFEKRNYTICREQEVERNGIRLKNYLMQKYL